MLQTQTDVLNFLNQEMPGEWPKKHITDLTMCLPHGSKFYRTPGYTECVHNTYGEIERLFQVIHTGQLENVCDPFSGTGTISKYLTENYKINVVTNDICDKHGNSDYNENALDDSFFQQFGQPFDAIITSPWFSVLDLAIPILLRHAKYFVAVHVPAYYVTNAHDRRVKYIKRLIRDGRVHIVGNLPLAVIGWKCIWLMIFKDRHIGKRYVKKDLRHVKMYL